MTGQTGGTNLVLAGGQFNWAGLTALTNIGSATISSGATLNFQTSGTLAALNGSGAVVVSATSTGAVGFGGVTSSFAGALTGSGALNKIGTGTWTLTGLGNALSNVVVSGGTLALTGGQLVVTNLTVLSGGSFALNTGTLALNHATVSNNADFVVGTGSGPATLNLLSGGTATFQNNLLVSSNATLVGAGTLTVAGGQGSVVIGAGATQAIGSAPGTLTINGTNVWVGGGQYVFDLSNANNPAGSGYDWLHVNGVLSNGATALNPFVINLTSLSGATPGLAVFDQNANYTFTLATATGGVANFAANAFSLQTNNFLNPYAGEFALAVQSNNLVLTYTGNAGFTWTDVSGTFNNSNNWISGQLPAVGQASTVLLFGGATNGSYTAQNDLNNLLTKRIVLTNQVAATPQYIVGNPFSFAGVDPAELDQTGAGAFVLSNNITLATALTADGTGSGTVALNGNISGNNSLTKTGQWSLVLGGSNTYSGATIVNDGHLFIANSYGLSGSTLSNQVPGAVVFTNITSAYLGGLAGATDLGLTNAAGTGVALVVGGNNQSTTYGGHLTGSGSLTKTGGGTLLLSGINTYSGNTTIKAGTLIAASLSNGLGGAGSSLGTGSQLIIAGGTLQFGASSQLVVTNPYAGSITMNGGTLQSAGLVNLGHLATLGNNTSTITSDLANPGYLDVTNGALVVNGRLFNDSTGVITNSAVLRVGATGLGWMTNAGQVVLAGGTLDVGLITNATSGSIRGRGTLTHAIANSGLLSATNGTLTIAGVATGTGTYRADAGATLTFSSGGQISSLFNTGATIRIAGGLLANSSSLFDNAGGTLLLAGAGYRSSALFTNNGWLTGSGSLNSAAALVNQGTIRPTGGLLTINSNLVNNTGGLIAVQSSALQVNGVFTNNGTLQVISGVGTYNNQVVNNNAWLSANATNTFNETFLITTNGYVAANANDVYIFKADLLNQSTNSASWNTLNVTPGTNTIGTGTEFLFSGAGSTQYFQTPGLLLTGGFVGLASNATAPQLVSGTAAGFGGNFAVGQLVLQDAHLTLTPSGAPDGLTNALFVNDLFLYGASMLVISNDLQVYFVNSNSWNLADITLLGNAQIHQLTGLGASLVIPEPNVLLMWLCGGVTLWAARRRHRRSQAQNIS